MTPEVFEVEEIVDADDLFVRYHRNLLNDGPIAPNVIKQQGDDGLSCDWSRYSTAAETRLRAKSPADNGVLSFNVGGVRRIDGLEVRHAPLSPHVPHGPNRAHSLILGLADETHKTRRRLALFAIHVVAIHHDAPVSAA